MFINFKTLYIYIFNFLGDLNLCNVLSVTYTGVFLSSFVKLID